MRNCIYHLGHVQTGMGSKMPIKYPPGMARITSGFRLVLPENLRKGLKEGDWIKIKEVKKIDE